MARTEDEGGRSRPGSDGAVRRVQPTEDDVEGHAKLQRNATGEDDVEGHAKLQRNATGGDDEEQDTEGHNLFAMSDYYVQSKMGRQKDIDRDARQRALVKEAKEQKPTKR